MKSDSGSRQPVRKQNWRLKKTLSRNIDIRPIEEEDIKFIWAAYKQGGLCDIVKEEDLNANEFKLLFEETVVYQYHGAWTIFADTKQGFIPIGIVLGAWHPLTEHLMVIGGIAWFPWASPRNIIEGTIFFFNKMRQEIQLMWYVRPEHKRLYEIGMKHGIMRRIGTSHTVFDVPATIFETRAK